jgi:hypothetical protein
MAGSEKELRTKQLRDTFEKAIKAFNKAGSNKGKDFENTFGQYLDDDAIVYSKSKGLGYHPKHAALMYLRKQCEDKPTFQLPSNFGPNFNDSYTGATIQGTTNWKDNNGAEPLLYNFTFVYDDKKGWRFSTLWAAGKRKRD